MHQYRFYRSVKSISERDRNVSYLTKTDLSLFKCLKNGTSFLLNSFLIRYLKYFVIKNPSRKWVEMNHPQGRYDQEGMIFQKNVNSTGEYLKLLVATKKDIKFLIE